MLNWRAVSRPAFILRRALEVPRRPIHVSTPRAQIQPLTLPRPNGILAKIQFRKDGKKRSRLVGAAFGALLTANMVTLLTFYNLLDDSATAVALFASVIYIQKVDTEYDTVNFDEPTETHLYFKRLYQSLTPISDEEIEVLFMDFERMFKARGDINVQLQGDAIMRKAADQIHIAFQALKKDSIAATANFVLLVMKEALGGLIDLVQDVDDDDSDSKYTFHLIKDRSRKDPGQVVKDYEVLG